MNTEIVNAVGECIAKPDSPLNYWVQSYEFHPETDTNYNQFIFMLKPELCRVQDGVDLNKILDLVQGQFHTFDVRVRAVRVFSSMYLKKHELIKKHYAVLDRVSKYGLDVCSNGTKERLSQAFPHIKDGNSSVIGSLEFLRNHPDFSPLALEILSQNVETKKLGSGVYAISLTMDDQYCVILNPFYPCQLDWFTTLGNAVVVFECISPKDLKDIRQKMVGATDPHCAQEGSIKNLLLKYKDEFKLPCANIRFNGIHVSPCPIEGLFATIRYFSDDHKNGKIQICDTSFGNLLIQNGMEKEQILELQTNPLVSADGYKIPLFDLTEDMNWEDALALIKRCYLINQ
ncbi:hypothetical protein MK805_14060 [Shimazuella sp. AN120528]|uniref:hypothetical protein n=1 Tax=Shimazuella soli TaxID=1892854 RepID=UPI001F0D69D6|nr:hypothetical protein [Shimazuella soli]MCH5586062.1 hypothetical protein [Shimazuella soli]